MSAHSTVWAWNQKAGKAKAVLVALANFADANGVCRVPQTHLAAMTESSVSTVYRHLLELEDRGLIAREKHWDDEGRQELDEIQLCGLRPEKRRVSGPVNLTAYREKPPVNLTAASNNSNSLLEFKSSTNNNHAGETPGQADPQAVDGVDSNPEPQAPDGAASGEAGTDLHSQGQLKNTHCDGENVNAQGNENVPPAAPSAYRAALDAVTGAGLLPVWRDWVRLNRLAQVSQDAQIAVWARWIQEGQSELLRQHAQDIIESGSFSHPWGALRKRMAAAPIHPITPTSTAELPFKEGQRVRYPDGTEAEVLGVRPAGITTDHPTFPDVPVGHLKGLKVIE